jgi:hypothetical protein
MDFLARVTFCALALVLLPAGSASSPPPSRRIVPCVHATPARPSAGLALSRQDGAGSTFSAANHAARLGTVGVGNGSGNASLRSPTVPYISTKGRGHSLRPPRAFSSWIDAVPVELPGLSQSCAV